MHEGQVPQPESEPEPGPELSRTEIRLYGQALRWPIPIAARYQIIKRLTRVLDRQQIQRRKDGTTTESEVPFDRRAIAAARVLLAADKLNLEQARLEQRERVTELSCRDLLAEAEAADQAWEAEANRASGAEMNAEAGANAGVRSEAPGQGPGPAGEVPS